MEVVENKLKVGQQFEVVEVLSNWGYIDALNIGGHTLHFKEYADNSGFTLINKFKSRTGKLFKEEYGCSVAFMVGREVKPVGRLTVKEVKENENTIT